MIRLRRQQPALQRRRFFQGRSIRGTDVKDISWFEPSGKEMDDAAWNNPAARCLGVRLEGRATDEYQENGKLMAGDTLFVVFNAHHGPIVFTLPPHSEDARWERLLDTAESNWGRRYFLRDGRYKLRGRSVLLLRLADPSR
jgi:glycogen operon protein